MDIYELHNLLHQLNYQSVDSFTLRYIEDHSITIFIATWDRWIYFYDRKNKYYPRFDSIDELLTFLETYNYGVLTCQK